MDVCLYKIITLHLPKHTYTIKQRVAMITLQTYIPAGTQTNCDYSVILIPPVCSTSDGLCKLIDVNYKLTLEFSVSSWQREVLEIPITLGTIPLLNEPLNQPFTYEPDAFAPDFLSLGANEVNQNQIVESNNNNFKPVYPYYKNL